MFPAVRVRASGAHVCRCRFIASCFADQLDSTSLHNLWIPDGSKDSPVDRWTPRVLLKESLEAIYQEKFPAQTLKDSVESKLFGIGSESYVAGSHEFYLGFALKNSLLPCLDMGHFHPTESVADKISSLLPFYNELVLHISRGVRWDSDHVVILDDDLRNIAHEIVRGGVMDKVYLALDFFDASMNRVGAWVVGMRAVLKSLLYALLEPLDTLKKWENEGDFFSRLAFLEELKSLPFGAVWDFFCETQEVPSGGEWISHVKRYENEVLRLRE